jgi:hypothetical protein
MSDSKNVEISADQNHMRARVDPDKWSLKGVEANTFSKLNADVPEFVPGRPFSVAHLLPQSPAQATVAPSEANLAPSQADVVQSLDDIASTPAELTPSQADEDVAESAAKVELSQLEMETSRLEVEPSAQSKADLSPPPPQPAPDSCTAQSHDESTFSNLEAIGLLVV